METVETVIRSAAQALAGTYNLPTHIIEEDLVHAILPTVKELGCPNVVKPNPQDCEQYCKLAEGEAQRLHDLKQALKAADHTCLYVVPPSHLTDNWWLATYRVNDDTNQQWVTTTHESFAALILSLSCE